MALRKVKGLPPSDGANTAVNSAAQQRAADNEEITRLAVRRLRDLRCPPHFNRPEGTVNLTENNAFTDPVLDVLVDAHAVIAKQPRLWKADRPDIGDNCTCVGLALVNACDQAVDFPSVHTDAESWREAADARDKLENDVLRFFTDVNGIDVPEWRGKPHYFEGIVKWNDSEATEQAEALAALELAIAERTFRLTAGIA